MDNHAFVQPTNDDENVRETYSVSESKQNGHCIKIRQCCLRCSRKGHELPSDPTFYQRCHHSLLLCPPIKLPGAVYTFSAAACLLWGSFWTVLGQDALPGGNIFGIVILFICASIGGNVIGRIQPLPPLLGMLLVGFGLRNIPVINVAADIEASWSSTLRTIALVVILIRAGLGLEMNKLRSMSGGALRLSIIPCLTETTVIAVLSHFIFTAFLLDFPWDWAFMLGFVHAAVSPAVIVPSMLTLQQQRLGTNKGIPTLIIAGGTLDDILAISGFSLVLGITFSDGSLAWNILRAPTEIIVGILYGLVAGFLCIYLPPLDHFRLAEYRFLILFMAGIFGEFGAKLANLSGAGALGVLVMAFVARQGWNSRGWPTKGEQDPMASYFSNMWVIFQPLLFGLIGAALDVNDLRADVIGWGTLNLVIALTFRVLVTYCAVLGVGLLNRERWFVAMAWLPKATVQAAIGSLALDMAKEVGEQVDEERGTVILALSVYIIIITAPIGATLIALTANKLLTKEAQDEESHVNEENEKETKIERSNSHREAVNELCDGHKQTKNANSEKDFRMDHECCDSFDSKMTTKL